MKQFIREVNETFNKNDIFNDNKNNDGEQESEQSNQDEYLNKEDDYNFTPSYETQLYSSIPLINFQLNYTGTVDTIKFGIGLD